MDEGGDKHSGYRWEGGYERTWEALREDDTGALISGSSAAKRLFAKKRLAAESGQRIHIVRHCVLALDLSRSMADPDLRIDRYPNRAGCAVRSLKEFVPKFFAACPLGQLALVILQNKRANIVVPLGGSEARLLKALNEIEVKGFKTGGQCSMVNGIAASKSMLNAVGEHSNREIIFVVGSLNTIDVTSPFSTIETVANEGIRCSVVSLSAEVNIWKKLAERTDGKYFVPLDPIDVSDKLEELSRPPVESSSRQGVLVKMGFPQKEGDERYICPQCRTRVKAIPTLCDVCKLSLVSAAHLARCYHHLFPPSSVTPSIPEQSGEEIDLELERSQFEKIQPCVGCGFTPVTVEEGRQFVICDKCLNSLCGTCDGFIDEHLHSCPGCI